MAEMIQLTPDLLQQMITAAVQAATTASATSNSLNHAVAEKPKRPTIKSCINQEHWTYFNTRWNRYKSMTSPKTNELVCHLNECCDEDLQLVLHRNVGQEITNKSEHEVLEAIKKLAVKEKNAIISRVVLRGMTQNPDEDIKHFAARVKS